MTNVWISAVGLFATTVIGSLLGFIIKELPHKWNDCVLGYCAGVMLAASTLGLIVPAFEMSMPWWIVSIGVIVGAMFLNVLDYLTPHLHHITGLDAERFQLFRDLQEDWLWENLLCIRSMPHLMQSHNLPIFYCNVSFLGCIILLLNKCLCKGQQ